MKNGVYVRVYVLLKRTGDQNYFSKLVNYLKLNTMSSQFFFWNS